MLYYQDNLSTIYCGDSAEVLKILESNSIDTCITDPPAGIAFMGKHWDKDKGGREQWIAWLSGIMSEVLRVLKPGAMCLVWSLPRTSHWTGMALEDAGFEIRDCIQHLFGTGFPKSLDVGKAIDKIDAGEMCRTRDLTFTAWMRSTGVTAKQINDVTDSNMGSHYLTDKEQPAVATMPMFEKMQHLLLEPPQEIIQLIIDRTVESENFKKREVIGKSDTGASEFMGAKLEGKGNGRGNEVLKYNITAPATDAAKLWDGYGTALKPAAEVWWLAMKPIEGTFAENAQKWGVAGLCIDGARVAGVVQSGAGASGFGSRDNGYKIGTGREYQMNGRWPANVVLSHHPECVLWGKKKIKMDWSQPTERTTSEGTQQCKRQKHNRPIGYADSNGKETVEDWDCHPECAVRVLDEQSGVLHGHGSQRHYGSDKGTFPWGTNNRIQTGGESGSASRFFYCAKPSRHERNEGLEDFYWRKASETEFGFVRISKEEWGKLSEKQRAQGNVHPTVKSIKLIEYLCKLTGTPTGGIVLDPFMGSGSILKAAKRMGRKAIGVDLYSENCEMAKARLNAKSEAERLGQEALDFE